MEVCKFFYLHTRLAIRAGRVWEHPRGNAVFEMFFSLGGAVVLFSSSTYPHSLRVSIAAVHSVRIETLPFILTSTIFPSGNDFYSFLEFSS